MKRNLSHFLRIVVAMLGFSLLSQGAWADAPSAEQLGQEPTLVKVFRVLNDGSTRIKYYLRMPGEQGDGTHFKTELQYKSGKKVTYELGSPSYTSSRLVGPSGPGEIWEVVGKNNKRIQRAEIDFTGYDYRDFTFGNSVRRISTQTVKTAGPTLRIVETPNKDGSITRREVIKEGQTGIHDRKGKEIAGGYAHLDTPQKRWIKTTVTYPRPNQYPTKTKVTYAPAQGDDHVRNVRITVYPSKRPEQTWPGTQPRISVSRCQGVCGSEHLTGRSRQQAELRLQQRR